jgi:two-component sensor histidine kinase
MDRKALVPGSSTAWTIAALAVAILVASSAAPFARFGAGSIEFDGGDLLSTLVYLTTWVPFIAAAAWIALRIELRRAAIGVHLALAATFPAAHTLLFLFLGAARSGDAPPLNELIAGPAFMVLTILGTLQYLVLLAIAVAMLAGRAAAQGRIRTAELEAQLARARMAALTSQLRPHFLFNALNSVSVLAATDPPAAQEMTRRLGTLLRAALATGEEATVALAAELELLEAYVAIQRVRFGDRLHISVDIDASARECSVPTLILQPLVENAIEHAVAVRERGAIAVTARREGERLDLTVSDDGGARNGSPPAADLSTGLGIGHANTRDRLSTLYGTAFTFDVTHAGTGCIVRIGIPATTARRAT